MAPNRPLMVSIILVIMNGAILATDDACAGGGCQDGVICLSQNCNQYSDTELEQYCLTTTGGIPGCCTVSWRCRDNIGGCSYGRLYCNNQRPRP